MYIFPLEKNLRHINGTKVARSIHINVSRLIMVQEMAEYYLHQNQKSQNQVDRFRTVSECLILKYF